MLPAEPALTSHIGDEMRGTNANPLITSLTCKRTASQNSDNICYCSLLDSHSWKMLPEHKHSTAQDVNMHGDTVRLCAYMKMLCVDTVYMQGLFCMCKYWRRVHTWRHSVHACMHCICICRHFIHIDIAYVKILSMHMVTQCAHVQILYANIHRCYACTCSCIYECRHFVHTFRYHVYVYCEKLQIHVHT